MKSLFIVGLYHSLQPEEETDEGPSEVEEGSADSSGSGEMEGSPMEETMSE